MLSRMGDFLEGGWEEGRDGDLAGRQIDKPEAQVRHAPSRHGPPRTCSRRATTSSMVYKFSSQGQKLLEINVGEVPDPARDFCGATDVAFAPNSRIFVTDGYCNARVIEYDSTGRKIRQLGRSGTGPGEFNVVHSIAVGPQGNLYVADCENGRLQWFDLDGKFLGQWKYGGQLYTASSTTIEERLVASCACSSTANWSSRGWNYDVSTTRAFVVWPCSEQPDGSTAVTLITA
jgi:6-bladed beta-propeller